MTDVGEYRADGKDAVYWKAEADRANAEIAKLKAKRPFQWRARHALLLAFALVCGEVMVICALIQYGGSSPMWCGCRICSVIATAVGFVWAINVADRVSR